jgi:hypothetical protein
LKIFICSSLLILSTLSPVQAQISNSSEPAPNSVRLGLPPPISSTTAAPQGGLSQVHDRLKLSDSQQELWSAYVTKIDDYNKVYYQEKPPTPSSGDAAPRQIGRLFDNMQNRLAAMDEIERTAKALYAVLDVGQKKTADQILLSTIPVFASTANFACPVPSQGKPRNERPDGSPHKRPGGGMGGMGQ